jgi:hypothetical protein
MNNQKSSTTNRPQAARDELAAKYLIADPNIPVISQ